MDRAAQIDQIMSALYSAAAVLIQSLVDPLAIEQASLKHRADALKATARMLETLQKVAPARPSDDLESIDFVFGEADQIEEDEPVSHDSGPHESFAKLYASDSPAASVGRHPGSRIPEGYTPVDILLGCGPSGLQPKLTPEEFREASAAIEATFRGSAYSANSSLAGARR